MVALLTVKAPRVALQFNFGAFQLAAFFANACAIMLASLFTNIAPLFLNTLNIVAQLGAGYVSLGSSRQAQAGDQGKGNKLGFHGYSPDWNEIRQGQLPVPRSKKWAKKPERRKNQM